MNAQDRLRLGASCGLALVLACFATPAFSEFDCVECHDVSPTRFAESIHGFLDCTDCHGAAVEVPHLDDAEPVDCGLCHEEITAEYAASAHGRARSNGTVEAPGCASCHGEIHELRGADDPDSPVHVSRQPDTCGRCHSDPAIVAKFGIPIARPIEAYRQSVHAKSVRDKGRGASCSDCHESHAILRSADAGSSVFHDHVPEQCASCHEEIAAAFRESVHGVAAARGVREAPVCTDCHGEHRILSPKERGSPVSSTNIPVQTCGRCHANVRLAEKYGMQADKVPAYADSYHGLAARSGSLTVAHCASCHGVHDIQPSRDPRSHIHPANLAVTCGKCHPGAGKRFAIGPVHVLATERRFALVYFVRAIYIPLIWVTVGAMLLHNFLDLRRKSGTVRPPVQADVRRERMSLGFRVAHGTVLVSFPLLVYTGFALTYPESWWARPILLWETQFGLRGWLHRAAAVLLLAGCLFHAAHVIGSRRARACIAAMRPGREDWHELRERIRYYLGRIDRPPRAPAVGYIEKVEYLAFLWGIVVMAGTGFLLWFENLALRWLPTWATDVATAIHFYEAILATLAIAVWHGYWIIFDPVVYPMDWSWWTGIEAPGRLGERDGPPDARPVTTRVGGDRQFRRRRSGSAS